MTSVIKSSQPASNTASTTAAYTAIRGSTGHCPGSLRLSPRNWLTAVSKRLAASKVAVGVLTMGYAGAGAGLGLRARAQGAFAALESGTALGAALPGAAAAAAALGAVPEAGAEAACGAWGRFNPTRI